jgi:hypothetical protein
MKTIGPALATVLALLAVFPARAQSTGDDRYTIMAPEPGTKPAKPEPWLAPKYRSPHGTRRHVHIPPPAPLPQHPAQLPPPLFVPQTGALLPNLPQAAPSGPNGSETSQDRAVRCAHQAGVYGERAGNPTAYINSCINQ